jgi:hypothetical protein
LLSLCLCLQTNLYQQGLQLDVLKVLSTTESVPNAFTVHCPNGAVESVCIGSPAWPRLTASHVNESYQDACDCLQVLLDFWILSYQPQQLRVAGAGGYLVVIHEPASKCGLASTAHRHE